MAKKRTKRPTITSINRKLDTLARDLCKLEADFTCQRCGERGDSSSIEWAHIEARRRKAIRWAPMNSIALCNAKINSCHYWFDMTRVASVMWLMENFPEKVEWLMEEVDGVSRSESLSTYTIQDRLDLVVELEERKRKHLEGSSRLSSQEEELDSA